MKRVIALVSCLTFFVVALGQSNSSKKVPDFSGTWLLDKTKSDFGHMPRGFVANYDERMVVVHREPELRISRKLVWFGGKEEKSEVIYYTDGRGETNPAPLSGSGGSGLNSKTTWKGNTLVSKASVLLKIRGDDVKIRATEELKISEDGKTLIDRTTTDSGQSGTRVIKLVYNRVP